MIYYCDRCRAPLTGGAVTCPQCGRIFDAPVPANTKDNSAESMGASTDALLRNRSASGSSGPIMSADTPPAWYGADSAAGKKRPLWLFVTAGLIVLIALLTLAGTGAYALWMRGAGGEIAFRQHNFAGNAASEQGDFQKANDEYSQMIALRPHRADGYLLRGINEVQQGLTTAAVADNTMALTLTQQPTMRGDLYYNRAEAQAKRGAQMKAVADFTLAGQEYARETNPRMLSLIPDREVDVYRLRAEAYWNLKNYALSIKDSKAAIAIGHVRPDDYGVQAKAETALGQYKAAEADFTQALKMDPDYLDGYVGLENVLEKQHQYAKAVAVSQQALQASPGSAQSWGSLGWFQYENDQMTQAIASDRHSQSIDSRQGWVNFNLALVYACTGQNALAKAEYANALANSNHADIQGSLTDIRHALAKQPQSSALHLALVQVQAGSTGPVRSVRAPLISAQAPPPPLPITSAPHPPAAFATLLSPEVVIDGYGIQPPVGYVFAKRREVYLSGSSNVYLWSGPRRADGTVPTIEVTIGRDDGSLAAHSTVQQVTQQALTGMGNNHTGLNVSPVQTVTLGSLTFATGDWDGTGVQTGKEYKGSEYWSVTPSHIIHVTSHDAVPYSHTTMPLLKASILTFRRV